MQWGECDYISPIQTDINECIVAALNGTEICTPPMFCINLAGSYRCECPGGTILTNGTCLEIGEHVECMHVYCTNEDFRVYSLHSHIIGTQSHFS